MTARGFATLGFASSRKNKVVSLTEEGRRFAERYALPALKAEQRAFGALEPCEQREIMRLIGKFSQVLGDECDAFKQHIAAESQAENQGEGSRATVNEVFEALSRACRGAAGAAGG